MRKKDNDLEMIPDVILCYDVEADDNAVQAPAAAVATAAFSNKINKIDIPDHDGDRVMFHGKSFCFVDAIIDGEYLFPDHHVFGLALDNYDIATPPPARQPTKKYQRIDQKEFIRQNHPPPFYKARTPTEARLLLEKILGDF